MVLFRYKLPNGNVLIWLGTGAGWGTSEGIDNVLALEGGDVLLLKTTRVISLWEEGIREDIKNLNYEDFVKKYELPVFPRDLWLELKEGVKTGKYPLFLENPIERINKFQAMISAYITSILQLRDPDEKIRQLEAIRDETTRKIFSIKVGLKK